MSFSALSIVLSPGIPRPGKGSRPGRVFARMRRNAGPGFVAIKLSKSDRDAQAAVGMPESGPIKVNRLKMSEALKYEFLFFNSD